MTSSLRGGSLVVMIYVRAAVGLVFPLGVDVLVPALIVRSSGADGSVGPAMFGAIPLIVAGTWLLLDSVFTRFAREGRGTLVPVDPPRFVVRGGAYRYVRNPMYVANIAIIIGEAIVFRSWHLFAWAGLVLIVFNAFVVLYEEPTLRRTFGDDYLHYQETTGRWLPHVR